MRACHYPTFPYRELRTTQPVDLCLTCCSPKSDRNLAGLRPEAEQDEHRAMELIDHHVCTNTRGLPSVPARRIVTPTWIDDPSLPPRLPQ
jgi:hypothetical protein